MYHSSANVCAAEHGISVVLGGGDEFMTPKILDRGTSYCKDTSRLGAGAKDFVVEAQQRPETTASLDCALLAGTVRDRGAGRVSQW